MTRWLVLALLLIATPAQAAVLWFAGMETGDVTEFSGIAAGAGCTAETTSALTGAYEMHCAANAAAMRGPTGLGLTTEFVRLAWQYTSQTQRNTILYFQKADNSKNLILFIDDASKKLTFSRNNSLTVIATGSTALSSGTWYQIEVQGVVSASVGGMEVKLCTPPPCTGSTEISSFVTDTSDITAIDHNDFGPAAGIGTIDNIFDDIMICTSAYCPHGGTVARQGTSGSPTYTAWTLNSCTGGTIDGCWSETPFTATTPSASSTVLNDAQTMIVHDFATTQTGHGGQVIGNASTINACKTVMFANAASGGTLTIRRRISATDTDTAKTITTSNAYYDDGIWTTTSGILRNLTVEIGAKQGANTVTQTVRDMGLHCDFLNASQAPKHRVIQQ